MRNLNVVNQRQSTHALANQKAHVDDDDMYISTTLCIHIASLRGTHIVMLYDKHIRMKHIGIMID